MNSKQCLRTTFETLPKKTNIQFVGYSREKTADKMEITIKNSKFPKQHDPKIYDAHKLRRKSVPLRSV